MFPMLRPGGPIKELPILADPGPAPMGEAGGSAVAAIFGLKAFGLRSSTSAMVFFLIDSFSMLLQHPLQLQFLQYSPLEKHSQ
jgi:hypothetical protein